MGRKTLSKEEQAALAQSRGYFKQKTSKEKNEIGQVEQKYLSGATKVRHVDVGEVFQNFLAAKDIETESLLQHNSALYKDFVEYYALSRYSRIDELPTVHSIDIVSDVASYIKGSLKDNLGLSTKKRNKYLVTDTDLTTLITYLWCSDNYDYLHERCRLQISFALLFFANSGARGGACVESSSYRGTNEAIAYKDCRVHLLREANGSFTFKLVVVQRLLKGKRDDENDNLEIVIESTDNLQDNGVMFFFTMAIADNAFKHFETLEKLLKARVPRGRDSWTLKWKDEALDRPVLRMVSSNGVHENRALTFASLRDQIVSLGKRAGYRDNVKIHAIRAGVANKIKDPQIRKQVMGQKSDAVYEEYYRSGLVKENIFALFSNKVGSTKHIEVLCSIGHQRDQNAPRDLTCKEKDEFYRQPEVQELNKRIKEATAKIPPNPDKGLAQFKERQKLYTEKKGEDDETLPKPASKFPLIRHLMPERNRIANALLVTKDLQSEEGQAVLQDLCSLCIDDNRVAYRPDKRPVDGVESSDALEAHT
ncbi:hypothetical protein V492_05999 [Pseudogymnoascus sp. VKM F-4246]|nr:hypothetical protein V492_05999 [Pseudogymnoascus sp. VKM F-4246]